MRPDINSNTIAYFADGKVTETDPYSKRQSEYADIVISETQYAIRLFNGQVASMDVLPNSTIGNALSGTTVDDRGKRIICLLFRKGAKEVPVDDVRLLVVNKNLPGLSLNINLSSAEGDPVTLEIKATPKIEKSEMVRVMALMERRYMFTPKIAVDFRGHFNIIQKEDLEYILSKNLEDLLRINHLVSKWTNEEIATKKDIVETDIKCFLEGQSLNGYWVNSLIFDFDFPHIGITETEYEKEQKELNKEAREAEQKLQQEIRLMQQEHEAEMARLEAKRAESNLQKEISDQESSRKEAEARRRREIRKANYEQELKNQEMVNNMKADLEKKLSEIRDQDREKDLEYQKQLLEIEKQRCETEKKVYDSKFGMFDRLASIIVFNDKDRPTDVARCPHCLNQVGPGEMFCPTCGKILPEIKGLDEKAVRFNEEAARLRNYLLVNLSADGTISPLVSSEDIESSNAEASLKIIADALTKKPRDCKISVSMINDPSYSMDVLTDYYAAIYKYDGKAYVSTRSSPDTHLPKDWPRGANPMIMETPIYIFYVKEKPYLYVSPDSDDGYVKVNGEDVLLGSFVALPQAAEIRLFNKYLVRISQH